MHTFIHSKTLLIVDFFHDTLRFGGTLATVLGELAMLMLLLIMSYIIYKITVKTLWGIIIPILKRTKNQFDDLLVKHSFFRNLAYLIPASLLFEFTPDIVVGAPFLIGIFQSLIELAFIVIFEFSCNELRCGVGCNDVDF